MNFQFSIFNFQKQRRGQAALIAVMLMLAIMISAIFGASSLALRQAKVAEASTRARNAYFAAEAGIEDAVYRIKRGKNVTASFSLVINGATATTTVLTPLPSRKEVFSSGNFAGALRGAKSVLTTSSGVTFTYGVQVGDGGLEMENTSQVIGSVYSNGDIEGENSPEITGDVFLAGSSTIEHVTVGGAVQTGLPTIAIPITDAQLDSWEADAALGGTISSPCPYEPANGASLGPIKITCDVIIDGTKIVTMTGPIWITGNFDIKNTAQLKLASSFG